MYCISNTNVHINVSTYLCVYLPLHTSSLVANWTTFVPSIRSVPCVFPVLLLISEYLVVIILDAVSMLLCVCKWLRSAARVGGGSKAIEPLCLTHGRNSDRKFPFAAAPGWNDTGMKKCKPEIQHFIILHHLVSLTVMLNTTQGQLDSVMDMSNNPLWSARPAVA